MSIEQPHKKLLNSLRAVVLVQFVATESIHLVSRKLQFPILCDHFGANRGTSDEDLLALIDRKIRELSEDQQR